MNWVEIDASACISHLSPTMTLGLPTSQTSRLVFTARLCPKFRMTPVRNTPEFRSLHATTLPVQSEYPAKRRAAAAVPLPESPQGQTSKSISSVSFVRIESNFFTIQRRHKRKKMMDQNFEIRTMWFLRIFWNFQKGIAWSLYGRSGPLWSRPN